MDVLFVNQTIFTKAICREFTWATYRKWILVMYALIGLWLISEAVDWWNLHSMGWFFITLCMIAFCFLFPLFHMRYSERVFYKRLKMGNSGAESGVMYEFSDRIRGVHSNKGEVFVDYTQIKKIQETKNLILLGLDSRLYLVLTKNGFMTGTIDDFRTFIREKCPSVHHPF